MFEFVAWVLLLLSGYIWIMNKKFKVQGQSQFSVSTRWFHNSKTLKLSNTLHLDQIIDIMTSLSMHSAFVASQWCVPILRSFFEISWDMFVISKSELYFTVLPCFIWYFLTTETLYCNQFCLVYWRVLWHHVRHCSKQLTSTNSTSI